MNSDEWTDDVLMMTPEAIVEFIAAWGDAVWPLSCEGARSILASLGATFAEDQPSLFSIAVGRGAVTGRVHERGGNLESLDFKFSTVVPASLCEQYRPRQSEIYETVVASIGRRWGEPERTRRPERTERATWTFPSQASVAYSWRPSATTVAVRSPEYNAAAAIRERYFLDPVD